MRYTFDKRDLLDAVNRLERLATAGLANEKHSDVERTWRDSRALRELVTEMPEDGTVTVQSFEHTDEPRVRYNDLEEGSP